MNNNQLDALFIFSLLSCHTSTCFGRISSPSSGDRMYIQYVANGTCQTSELTVSSPGCQACWVNCTVQQAPFNYKLLLIECHYFQSKPISIIQKIILLSRKTSPPCFSRKIPTTVYPSQAPRQFYIFAKSISFNSRSRILGALSNIHSTYSKVGLKIALKTGPKNIAEFII
jgi:hypothetical protein